MKKHANIFGNQFEQMEQEQNEEVTMQQEQNEEVTMQQILGILTIVADVTVFEIMEDRNFTGEYITIPTSLLKEIGINKDAVKICCDNGKIEIS